MRAKRGSFEKRLEAANPVVRKGFGHPEPASGGARHQNFDLDRYAIAALLNMVVQALWSYWSLTRSSASVGVSTGRRVKPW